MLRAHDPSPNDSLVQRDRRLVTGIVVSALLHGLLLSLQFGIPGFDSGSGGPIQVTLTPPAPRLAPEAPPGPVDQPALALPPLPPAPTPSAAPARGLRLVDPRPQQMELAQAVQPKPAARPVRRQKPKRRAPVAPPVLASTGQSETPFVVAPPPAEIEPDLIPSVISSDAEASPEPDDAAIAAREDDEARESERQSREEAERIAAAEAQQRQEAETARLLREEQDLVTRREREALAQREAALQAEERQRLERQQAEQKFAEQELAARQLAEQQLVERQQAEQRAAEQRQAEQLAAEQARIALQQQEERRRAEAERQRLAQLREREEALARQLEQQRNAERLAAERLAAEQLAAEELARYLALALAEEQARRRAEELAQHQAGEEQARRLAEEQARSERLAREQAEEAGRRAAAERLQAAPGPALAGNGLPGLGGPGKGSGAGSGGGAGGGGARPGGGAPGSAMASRASELLRGINIPNVAPPVRPRDDAAGARRALADGAERDVPLRLYVDSVRQKLERTAVLGGARFSLREVRIDPLVSLTLRSDGSVDDVTIVRSSGRADMDDAVRRFVRLNARYSAFPPNVAARFDIIEIRRIWRFADGLKLLEEMR